MPLSDDPWVAKYSIIDPERLHALGTITLCWNHCERNHMLIFAHVLNLDQRRGWIVAHDMGDISMSDKIKEAVKWENYNTELAQAIECYLKIYDACRQNRNALTHFTASIPSPSIELAKSATFTRMKGIKGEQNTLPSSLEDIRRVAEEIHTFVVYSWSLHKSLEARRKGQPSKLPQLVLPPELLVKPLQANSPKHPPQRQPGRGGK
jgi:hypothetical protein